MNRHERRKADAQLRKGILPDDMVLTMTPEALIIVDEMQALDLAEKEAAATSVQSGRMNGLVLSNVVPVRATFPDGTYQDFESQGAAVAAGFRQSSIISYLKGRLKSHGGAKWAAIDPNYDGVKI